MSGKTDSSRAGGTRRSPVYLAARWLMAAAVVAVIAAFGSQPVPRRTLPPREGPPIADARSWGYQLQNVKLQAIADGVDLLVVDYSRDGSEQRVLRPGEVDALRTRADGSRRIVLAYMSIGEAENYRFYWRRSWSPGHPSWIGPENPAWRGNFQVRYWERGWRDIIMQPQVTLFGRISEAWQPANRAYLDRILEAGFDGVYLDRIDAFDHWSSEHEAAQADMIAFVTTLSSYAKQRRPGFLVVAQNGEELLRSAEYRGALDAIAKEDLLFGVDGDGIANGAADVSQSIADLNRVKAAGRPVFVVEYLTNPAQRAEAQRRISALGFILQFAQRDLRQIPE